MIVMTMGVSGAGKSTVAAALAERLGWPFLEADDLHSPANVAKMRAGHPLTDADRGPWLDAIADRLRQFTMAQRPAVLACSALRRDYRQRLQHACRDWLILYLKAREDDLRHRLRERKGHFMPAALLESQFATLEEPQSDEQALVLDAQAPLDVNVSRALAAIESHLRSPG